MLALESIQAANPKGSSEKVFAKIVKQVPSTKLSIII